MSLRKGAQRHGDVLPIRVLRRRLNLHCSAVHFPPAETKLQNLMKGNADGSTQTGDADPLWPALDPQLEATIIERQMAEIDLKGAGSQEGPELVKASAQGTSALEIQQLCGEVHAKGRGDEEQIPVHAVVPKITPSNQKEVWHHSHGQNAQYGPNCNLTLSRCLSGGVLGAKIHAQKIGGEPA